MKSGSNLEKILDAGHFAVTGECGPPRSADPEVIRRKARHLKGQVDAVNMTDNQTSVVRMSSLAGSLILQQEGLEANMQMVWPGPQPDRHPVRHPRRLRPGHPQPAVPFRRPPEIRRSPVIEKRLRPGFHAAHPDRQDDAGRTPAPLRPGDAGRRRAAIVHRRRGQPLCRSL